MEFTIKVQLQIIGKFVFTIFRYKLLNDFRQPNKKGRLAVETAFESVK